MNDLSYIKSSTPRKVINTVVDSSKKQTVYLFATRNQNKLKEYQRLLGKRVDGIDLKVPEIQDPDPLKVLEEKAKAAYALNRGPIYVEDSSLTLASLDNMIGPYADNETNSRTKLEAICRMFGPNQARDAVVTIGIAIYDGQEVYTWIGEVHGTIADSPRGANGFGFDPIFIPKGAKKTNAEMSDSEKDSYSPRRLALEKLLKNPVSLTTPIFQLQEPMEYQLGRIQKEELVRHADALRFAFSLDMLEGIKPNKDLLVEKFHPFYKKSYANGAVVEYTSNSKSAGMGLVLLSEVDLKTIPDDYGKRKAIRLDVTSFENPDDPDEPIVEPVLLQMGPKGMEVALASRAAEYLDMHSPEMHQHVRYLLSGKIQHVARTTTRSRALEEILGMKVTTDERGLHHIIQKPTIAIATKELGYKRESFDGKLSRKQAAKGTLMLGPDGVVSSVYAMGGMPPVSGSVDSIVTAAMSYMRIWIPRNGIFAGNFDRQLALFKEAKKKILSFKLPKDIERQVVAQIGIAVGCENPKAIALQIKKFQKLGGHAVRIYTTNPDIRIVETVEAICKAVGENFLICVGPVTDIEQARALHERGHVRMFLAGHGGGENCTSLTAGGAANSIELLYEMYLEKLFNDSLIGLEGGTGTTIGALLPMLDVISLNRRGSGGIENTGGLYAKKMVNGKTVPVLPYHGDASAVTQLIESYINPSIARKRLGLDGIALSVEGKPNYMVMADPCRSNVNRIREARAYVGLSLADQQSLSMYGLREKVAKKGHNHIGISSASSVIAGEHRAGV